MKAIILGTNSRIRRIDSSKSYPLSLETDRKGRTILDWQISVLRDYGIKEIVFVGGYHIEKVLQLYPEIKVYYNEDWQTTGSLFALQLARSEFDKDVVVLHSDIIFRKEAIESLCSKKKNAVCITTENEKTAISQEQCALPFFYLSQKALQAVVKLDFTSENKVANLIDLVNLPVGRSLSFSDINVTGHCQVVEDQGSIARFILGTKAETLERLKDRISSATVLDQVCFSVNQWQKESAIILERIKNKINHPFIIVRSSTETEDSWNQSCAGQYHSVLGVSISDDNSIQNSIDAVINSYPETGNKAAHQILVQPYINNSVANGVIFSCDRDTGAPYIVINYAISNSTDSVTNGSSVNARVATIYKNGGIPKGLNSIEEKCLALINELERILLYNKLDVEFCIDQDEQIYLFQVRPLAVEHPSMVDSRDLNEELNGLQSFMNSMMQKKHGVLGNTTIFSTMPDWNPAEIIGKSPRPLAFSLYKYLITNDVWAKSRYDLGYRDVRSEVLLVSLAGKPYVDVRASFTSFIPNSLNDSLSDKLVSYYLNKLKYNPELFDKVEFEVALTCKDFNSKQQYQELASSGFKNEEIDLIDNALTNLTTHLLKKENDIIGKCEEKVRILEDKRKSVIDHLDISDVNSLLRSAKYLLDDCKIYGTLPFSSLARCAFVGNALLRSALKRNFIKEEVYNDLLQSVPTVASHISEQIDNYISGKYSMYKVLEDIGHLRPGTYDIMSLSYDEAPELYFPQANIKISVEQKEASIPEDILRSYMNAFEDGLKEAGINVSADECIDFIVKSIKLREWAKFEFTKNISLALKYILLAGNKYDISRHLLSMIPIDVFHELALSSPSCDLSHYLRRMAGYNEKRFELMNTIQLPETITDKDDVVFFRNGVISPNFVTNKIIRAETVFLDNCENIVDINKKIICIEKADPGYDWIFSHDIMGLITKFGGIASHMAIRSAEFGLPAAIGCGEVLFRQIKNAKLIELNCESNQLNIIR